mmetsp:Transcript_43667/g.114756  ORF Transcript_43667/g.114756 Transcript_43667/m.114756 type:complete len:85 (+) Transcript_43667:3-257(+)
MARRGSVVSTFGSGLSSSLLGGESARSKGTSSASEPSAETQRFLKDLKEEMEEWRAESEESMRALRDQVAKLTGLVEQTCKRAL